MSGRSDDCYEEDDESDRVKKFVDSFKKCLV